MLVFTNFSLILLFSVKFIHSLNSVVQNCYLFKFEVPWLLDKATKNNNSPPSEMLCLHRLRVEDNDEDQNPSLDSCSDNTPSRAWSWIKSSVELCKYGFNSSGKHVCNTKLHNS